VTRIGSATTPDALAGVRVVEMGQLIAGPFAAKTLGEFGVRLDVPPVLLPGRIRNHTARLLDGLERGVVLPDRPEHPGHQCHPARRRPGRKIRPAATRVFPERIERNLEPREPRGRELVQQVIAGSRLQRPAAHTDGEWFDGHE